MLRKGMGRMMQATSDMTERKLITYSAATVLAFCRKVWSSLTERHLKTFK